jgi:serine/threonine protein kinase
MNQIPDDQADQADQTIIPGRIRRIAPGDRLRDWEIESLLGSGSFGTVWKARRSRLGGYQVAAVKVLDRVLVADVREQLIAEFTLLSSIEHPNLLRYLDAFEIEDGRLAGFVVFVLELADTDLKNAIAQSSTGLPEREVCAAFAGLADGLAAFHDLGNAHGDIKPANILRVGDTWKLADFGIAAPLDGSYSLVGGTTFDYCPPEELIGLIEQQQEAMIEAGGRRLHRTADVWALGISLHYAVAKRHPYVGESVRARMASVMSDTRSIAANLSPGLSTLLDKRVLTSNHHQRISANELAVRLRELVKPTANTAPIGPPPPFAPTPPTLSTPSPVSAPASFSPPPSEVGVTPTPPSNETPLGQHPPTEQPLTYPPVTQQQLLQHPLPQPPLPQQLPQQPTDDRRTKTPPITVEAQSSRHSPRHSPRPGRLVALGISAVIAAALIIAWLVVARGNKTKPDPTTTTVVATEASDIEPSDTGPIDTGPIDTGPIDTGPIDTGPIDAGPFDLGVDTDSTIVVPDSDLSDSSTAPSVTTDDTEPSDTIVVDSVPANYVFDTTA